MKKTIGFLIVFLIMSCQPQESRNCGRYKTIAIKAMGEVETFPDFASFRINLSCLESTAKQSKKCLVEKSNELIHRLLGFGIDKDDILTASVDLKKSYTWSKNTRVFQGYNSSTSVYLKIRNINNLDEIYTELLENGNLNLSGLSYSHSKLDSLKNNAYADALKRANILADKLIDELPEDEKEILNIRNVETSTYLPELKSNDNAKYMMDMDDTSALGDESVAISKGTIRVDAILFVEYRIK